MEIYSAISDFKSPDTDGSQNILSFKKGDTFEVFDCNKTSGEWWGARAVINNIVGYVPSKYMKFHFIKSKLKKYNENKTFSSDT
jgi:glutamate formiminotransferase